MIYIFMIYSISHLLLYVPSHVRLERGFTVQLGIYITYLTTQYFLIIPYRLTLTPRKLLYVVGNPDS